MRLWLCCLFLYDTIFFRQQISFFMARAVSRFFFTVFFCDIRMIINNIYLCNECEVGLGVMIDGHFLAGFFCNFLVRLARPWSPEFFENLFTGWGVFNFFIDPQKTPPKQLQSTPRNPSATHH